MKKHIPMFIVLVLIFTYSAPFVASAQYGVEVTGAAQIVDSITFDGVTVNAIYAPYTTIKNYGSNSTYCCAAFVSKFYSQVYGITVYNLTKNGGGPKVTGNKGFFTTTSSPQIGDVVHYKTSTKTHWSIVKNVSGNTVTIIEQNGWNDYERIRARVGKQYTIGEAGVTFYRYSNAVQNNGSQKASAGTTIPSYIGYITGTNGAVAIRSGPSSSTTQIGRITEGSSCIVYPDKSSGMWYWVEFGGIQGYSYGAYISKSAPPVSSVIAYIVTFNANGGSVSTNSKTVTNGSSYGTLPTPTRNGYTFDGWYTSASGGSQITTSSTVNLNGDQTLYAHWTVKQYTVFFNPNGGSVSTNSMTVTNGSSYGTLPTPARNGYTFDGWYTSASGGSRITASSTVNLAGNQTLYAHWSIHTHSYDSLGKCTVCGEEYPLSITTLNQAMEVTTVNGSGTAPAHTTPYGEATITKRYSKGDSVTVVGQTNNAYGNLWYKLSDGSWMVSDYITKITAPAPTTSSAPQTPTIRLNASEIIEGATATVSWASDPNAKKFVVFVNNSEITVTTNSYTISGLPVGTYFIQVYADSGTICSLLSNTVTLTVKAKKSTPADTESTPPQSKQQYTVYFDLNGGGAVSPNSKTVINGDTYGTLPTPARGNYTFDGWFTSPSGGRQITSATTVDLGSNQTLFAHWSIVINPAIALNQRSLSMEVGNSYTLIAMTTPDNQSVTWSSSDTSVATVRGGTVSAVGSGSATITGSFNYNGSTYSASCSVTVSAAESTLTIKVSIPSTIRSGVSYSVIGYVNSNYELTGVNMAMYREGSQVSVKILWNFSNPNYYSMTSDLASMLNGIKQSGTYSIEISATDASGKTVNKSVAFTVQ